MCLNQIYLTGQPLTTFCAQALQNVLHLAAGQDCGLCVSSSGWAVGIDACQSPPYKECFYSPGIFLSDLSVIQTEIRRAVD